MMRIKRASLFGLFCILQITVMAQTEGYHYMTAVDSITTSGFYNIVMTPAINSHLKNDYSDLRIINNTGNWIPHLIRMPNREFTDHAVLQPLTIKQNHSSTLTTEMIVESNDSIISNLFLEIKNTQAERFCNLTGSDDLENWFIINDSILINPIKNDFQEYTSFEINFPRVNYKYLKVIINNKGKEPFNIPKIYTNAFLKGGFKKKGLISYAPLENPACTIVQRDSGNCSYIKITQAAPYHFDKINLKVSGPKYYRRNAAIYFPVSPDHSFSNPGILKESIVLSNNSTLEYDLPRYNAAVFYIIIQNEDNLPLKVDDTKTSVDYTIATAWLEQGINYKIILDNNTAQQPNYDLQPGDIKDKQIQVVATGTIVPLQQDTIVPSSNGSNKKMIWLFIAIAVVVLAFFTWKLVKDMSKNKT